MAKLKQAELRKKTGHIRVMIKNVSKQVKVLFGYPLMPNSTREFYRTGSELAMLDFSGIEIYSVPKQKPKSKLEAAAANKGTEDNKDKDAEENKDKGKDETKKKDEGKKKGGAKAGQNKENK